MNTRTKPRLFLLLLLGGYALFAVAVLRDMSDSPARGFAFAGGVSVIAAGSLLFAMTRGIMPTPGERPGGRLVLFWGPFFIVVGILFIL